MVGYVSENEKQIKQIISETVHNAKKITTKKNRKKIVYYKINMGFDIETTNIITEEYKRAYMYHWQLSFNDNVFMGRTWDEFTNIIEFLQGIKGKCYFLIWVANLSFEFQFICHRLEITSIFAKEERQILTLFSNNLHFAECLSISGSNLANLAKDYCKTQKLKGDLDYSIIRNSCTPLTDTEKQYCINDVVILSEWADYMWSFIEEWQTVPCTKTQQLRMELKDQIQNIKAVNTMCKMCYPKNQTEYNALLHNCFRGGYTHANAYYTDEVLKDVVSYDFTSSYPAVMNQKYFPVSPFLTIKNPTVDIVENYVESKCCLILAKFDNIKQTTSHSIESFNKLLKYENVSLDNGRVRKADSITVYLTELDFETYKEFYTWEKVEIYSLQIAERGKLPKYAINVMNKYYKLKCDLKEAGKSDTIEYLLSKQRVNSNYGMMVTRHNIYEYIFNETWEKISSKKTYEDFRNKAFLLPQWGVWVTAHARRNLLKTVFKIGNDCIYCDTDSIYLINHGKHKHIFEEYNKEIIEINKSLFNDDCFYDLGCFDFEGTYPRFKTLGAKRYIKDKYNKKSGKYETVQTISGLPKTAFVDYCKKYNLNPYEEFKNELTLKKADSTKKTTCYNDEPHGENVIDCNGISEFMFEYSSVAIYDIPFKMSLSEDFVTLLKFFETMKVRLKNE